MVVDDQALNFIHHTRTKRCRLSRAAVTPRGRPPRPPSPGVHLGVATFRILQALSLVCDGMDLQYPTIRQTTGSQHSRLDHTNHLETALFLAWPRARR